jgi:alcohol dehydrogenase YqhD (iron-dependent ADH family)
MNPFTFHNPTKVLFGEGQIAAIAEHIPRESKVLVIYGGGSIKQNGVYDQVKAALADYDWAEIGGIEPNPQYDTLMKAVEKIRAEGFDYLLAVGGGSVVDGSKFIAAAALYKGDDPWEMMEGGAEVVSAVPMSCILTLPATGSETNCGAVVSRGDDKLAFFSPLVRPAFAVLDPATTLSLSPRQVSNGVIDAFVHTMEQYLTYPVDAKVQDRFAEGLLLTLIEEGPKALANPDDLAVRSNIMWSATQALNGLIGAGVPQDWTTHMIGHELTGLHGVDHARSLSIVMPGVLKNYKQRKQDKLLQYGQRVFGITQGNVEERVDAAIAKTEAFFTQMDVPTRLSHVDIKAADIDALMTSLEKHGRLKLGEHSDIDLVQSRAILTTAL